jgi:hypothetical protein
MPLFAAGTGLADGARARLTTSWAEWFRREVMPELLAVEERFAGLYTEQGRPNWSVARLLGLCLLQHLYDLSDQQALDALSFDLRWQHALGLTPEQAYLSRRSLVEFRRRLVKTDPDGGLVREVFDRICARGIGRLQLSTSEQRLDSTAVCSNIRGRGRLSLARETLRVFVRSLDETQRARLPEPVRAWYEADDEGWEQPEQKYEADGRLAEVGAWISAVLEVFEDDDDVRDREPYQLLQRLLKEHADAFGIEPTDAQAEAEAEDNDDTEPPSGAVLDAPKPRKKSRRKRGKKRNGSKKASRGKARYWSPHDPDASFGHKGLGYHVHITETCRNEGAELITDYDVVTGAQPDVGLARPVIERLKARKLAPEALYADGGYPTPDDLVWAGEQQVDLYTPVHRGPMAKDALSRADFEFNDAGEVERCPAGHAPSRHGPRESSDTQTPRRSLHAFFDAATCHACPQRARCPVRTPNHARARDYRLDLAPELRARDQRFAEQSTEPWRERYRIRAGVEATMSELKRGHGLDRLRVRRLVRVRVQVAFKAIACNLKRWQRASAALRSLFVLASAVLTAVGAETGLSTAPGGSWRQLPRRPLPSAA